MEKEDKQDYLRIFNLMVKAAYYEEDVGMEYGNFEVLEKLVQETMAKSPQWSEEEARGYILRLAITDYAIKEWGEKEEEDIWGEGQRKAKEKYGLLPAP